MTIALTISVEGEERFRTWWGFKVGERVICASSTRAMNSVWCYGEVGKWGNGKYNFEEERRRLVSLNIAGWLNGLMNAWMSGGETSASEWWNKGGQEYVREWSERCLERGEERKRVGMGGLPSSPCVPWEKLRKLCRKETLSAAASWLITISN